MSRLIASNLSVSFGSLVVLDGVSLSIGAGDRIGIIAPNGVGKSTLLKVLAGDLEPDAGAVTRSPATTTVLRLAQEPDIRRWRVARRAPGPADPGSCGPGRP